MQYHLMIKLSKLICRYGILQVNIIRMPLQLAYFQQYQQRLRALVGSTQAKRIVNQALVLITLGGNDFVNNYYLVPYSARSRQYSLTDYVPFLISEYKKILMVSFLCILFVLLFPHVLFHERLILFLPHLIIASTVCKANFLWNICLFRITRCFVLTNWN